MAGPHPLHMSTPSFSGSCDLSDLADDARLGHREALESLLRALEGELVSLACWKLKDFHAAQDIVQETLLEITRAISRLEDPSRVRSWAMTILSHNLTDAVRRRNLLPPPLVEPSYTDQDRNQILEAFQKIPDEYRQVLILRHLQGFRYREIAETLGLPIGTVRSRIARGDDHLVQLLEVKP